MEALITLIGETGNGSDDQISREIRISEKAAYLVPVRPRMQDAGLQCLELRTAVAFPPRQNRAFPGAELSRKTRSPKSANMCMHYYL